MRTTLTAGLTALFLVTLAYSEESGHSDMHVYVGTYTNREATGIYLFRMDGSTGRLTEEGLAVESNSPSFLALHPNGRFMYAVNEQDAAVSSFAIDRATGKLTFVNQHPSRGATPCHLTVDPSGQCVLVANYTGGSAAVLPIDLDGSLKPATGYVKHEGKPVDKAGPHAHSINVDPANRFAFVPDVGLDEIFVYRFDPKTGALKPNDPRGVATPKVAGPRHFAFGRDGKYAYVINETNNTVIVYSYDAARGVLAPLQTISTIPDDFEGETWTSEIQVHPSGQFLYGSNRGHDSIVVYSIHPADGRLELVEYQSTQGKMPRGFGIDPSGRFFFAANQESDTIVTFRIDVKSGALTPTGDVAKVSMPVCVKFLPAQAAQ